MNPLYINYFLICVYGINSIAWLLATNYPQSLYWFGALVITVAVTWGIR